MPRERERNCVLCISANVVLAEIKAPFCPLHFLIFSRPLFHAATRNTRKMAVSILSRGIHGVPYNSYICRDILDSMQPVASDEAIGCTRKAAPSFSVINFTNLGKSSARCTPSYNSDVCIIHSGRRFYKL